METPDLSSPSRHVERARELFFAQGRDAGEWLAPHIARSWQRSRPAIGHAADTAPLRRSQLTERREQAMRLLECAQPELDSLAEHVIGNACVVILSDASGLILDEIGSPDFLPQAERHALCPGVEWSEQSRGTNAIGTALAERQALMVLGGEHYLPQNGALGCAAAPIFTGRGEIAGVLDISGETVRINPHALGLVRMAAQQVEHRMMLAEASGHLLRFHRRPALLGTAREGLVVIDGGRIVGANRSALDLLGASWQGLLGSSIEPLLGRRWTRLETQRGLVTLPDGRQVAATLERSATPPGGSRRATRVDAPAPVDTGGRAASPPVGSHQADASAPSHAGDVLASAPVDSSDAIAPLLARALKVLNEGVPVLVSGETGSGKEVFARRLHAAGRRSHGPFVAVNCAAIPETLIEAELFGYVDGAYTGARRKGMPGRLREADGGVLFLDEIADMPLGLQTRLLRVLEERVVVPLGGGPSQAVDFDLVCATHGDLATLSAAGRFRSDLLYRVAGFRVAVPALRDRPDRRALIARLFAECGGAAKQLHLAADALELLAAMPWPGNVRQLRSALRSMVALADDGAAVGSADLLLDPTAMPTCGADAGGAVEASNSSRVAEPLEQITRKTIEAALEACDRNVAEAARRLGVHRSTVYRHRAKSTVPGE